MCGIYGVYGGEGGVAQYRGWLEEASRLLRHRGPDGSACLARMGGRCLLGHSRLAIIDLEGGAQPIANEDETIWVILNGEIYNYVEIRERLIAQGAPLSHPKRHRSAGASLRRERPLAP